MEKERNSANLLDFFGKSSMTHKQVEQPSSEEPIKNQRQQSTDHSAGSESVADSSSVHMENVFSVVSQGIASTSAPGSPPTIGNDPEEYCTLVLTTLSTADYQTSASENKYDSDMCKTLNSSTLNCHVSQQLALFSPSSTEEENSAIVEEELEQCDLDETSTYKGHTQTSIGKENNGVAGPSSSPEKNQLLQSNGCLEAIRKHDKEQAESMVLEGRVQMLTVPRKKSVYFCNQCSFATDKEVDFERHCQTVCHSTTEQHGHQASDAQSKPKQSVDGHKAKTCPGLQRKMGTVISIPLQYSASGMNSAVGQKEMENQMTSQELQVRPDPGTSDLAPVRPGTRLSMSRWANCKDSVLEALSGVELRPRYALQEDGKFACTLCNFTSVRVATVERHFSKCERRRGDGVSMVSNKSKQESVGLEQSAGTQEVRCEGELLSCPNLGVQKPDLQCPHCAFRCKQEQSIMARHMALKHRDTRPSRAVCGSCGKMFGSSTKLRQHNLRVHHRQPSHFCPQCDFAGFTSDDVRRHQCRCHANVVGEELRHPCTFCTAEFSSAVALRNHCRRVHVPQMEDEQQQTKESADTTKSCATKYQCHLCTVVTKTRRLLARHLLTVHEEGSAEDKPLRCNTCEFACRHQLVLEQHLRSHGGSRLYKCADCSFSTQNKQKMTWHLRIHTGEKPYGCEQCRYTCTDPLRLKVCSQFKNCLFVFKKGFKSTFVTTKCLQNLQCFTSFKFSVV